MTMFKCILYILVAAIWMASYLIHHKERSLKLLRYLDLSNVAVGIIIACLVWFIPVGFLLCLQVIDIILMVVSITEEIMANCSSND